MYPTLYPTDPGYWTVRLLDPSRWHSHGVAGDTVYATEAEAVAHVKRFEHELAPGQRLIIIAPRKTS